MSAVHYVTKNLDGKGARKYRCYSMDPVPPDFWAAVTDVPCPICHSGQIRWHEAGYVPGYRICDGCKRHFLAQGTVEQPILVRMGRREGFN